MTLKCPVELRGHRNSRGECHGRRRCGDLLTDHRAAARCRLAQAALDFATRAAGQGQFHRRQGGLVWHVAGGGGHCGADGRYVRGDYNGCGRRPAWDGVHRSVDGGRRLRDVIGTNQSNYRCVPDTLGGACAVGAERQLSFRLTVERGRGDAVPAVVSAVAVAGLARCFSRARRGRGALIGGGCAGSTGRIVLVGSRDAASQADTYCGSCSQGDGQPAYASPRTPTVAFHTYPTSSHERCAFSTRVCTQFSVAGLGDINPIERLQGLMV